jgi:hypothetical protein
LPLLASSIASSSNRFLGICSHPSSMTQSNIPKALTIASWVLSDASTFLSSLSSCASFGFSIFYKLLNVFTRRTICFFSRHLHYCQFYFFLNNIKYLINNRRTKNNSQPLPFRRFFCLSNYFFRFLYLNNYFFCFLTILPSPFF